VVRAARLGQQRASGLLVGRAAEQAEEAAAPDLDLVGDVDALGQGEVAGRDAHADARSLSRTGRATRAGH
jgi:hypothetical protein